QVRKAKLAWEVRFRQLVPGLDNQVRDVGAQAVHPRNKSPALEQLELDCQIFLRVLAKVIKQLHAFRRQVVDVGVELVVRDQLAERAFATLGAGHYVVDSFGGGVETRNGRARVI